MNIGTLSATVHHIANMLPDVEVTYVNHRRVTLNGTDTHLIQIEFKCRGAKAMLRGAVPNTHVSYSNVYQDMYSTLKMAQDAHQQGATQ